MNTPKQGATTEMLMIGIRLESELKAQFDYDKCRVWR
jgi:hypothetical protein